MAKQKAALGKGLGALITKSTARATSSQTSLESGDMGDRVLEVPISEIEASPLQPRKYFSDEQLEEMVESIREHGVIQPLIVRKVGDIHELIAGERRWRAATKLELLKVPVIIREASDQDVLEMALIENLQREDLNPLEEAEAYVRLTKEFQLKQEDVAKRVGKNRATVANAMRLLELDASVQTLLTQNRISVGHAKVILSLKEHDAQRMVADLVVRQGLTVRATEKLVAKHLNPDEEEKKPKPGSTPSGNLPSAIARVQDRLQEHFATKVGISHSDKKGKIEIEYYGEDDLQRVMEVLGIEDERY